MTGIRMSASLTDKGHELASGLGALELKVAGIWREPFENYGPEQQLDWRHRRDLVEAAFRAALNEELGDGEGQETL